MHLISFKVIYGGNILFIDDIVGEYALSMGPFNNWHYVTITKRADGSGYTWKNRAGRSWTLTYKSLSSNGENIYAVGRNSPYYTFANGEKYRSPKLHVNDLITEFEGPFYERYTKIKDIKSEGR